MSQLRFGVAGTGMIAGVIADALAQLGELGDETIFDRNRPV